MIKRKTRGVAALMSLVVLCGLAMSASAQHEPLPTWDNCPGAHTMFAPLPAFVNGTVGSPVTSWPEVGSYDFCAYMDTLYCQLKPLVAVASEVADYADLLRCLDADINGVLYNQPPAIVPVTISVNSAGECTVYWNNILTHSGIAIPGWSPQADWHMGFGGRTGSLNDYHVVDDFDLVSPGMNYTEFFTTGAGLGTLYGDGLIDSSQLALTENVDSQTGSWSFLPTDPVTEFTVTYMQYIGDGSGADGMCFFYGPGANSAFGEEGPVDTTGLRLTFYTNVPDNVVRLAYNGTTLLDAA
ncbi:MAG: hypothetical protein KAH38_09270, partial [Candidatus Hydrogenedentes bacterium]|nr:hypothetical protein [Candidatus Hydrogenedentota bacterium]